jgi:UDP-N-acetylglucosamine diphosphorylase/glucosamine-1-phosphate N-acetyltransferase
MKKNLKVIILAAGRGKRLGSETADCPKVMRLADGKPLLGHVLGQIPEIEKKDVTIIVGYKREAILEAFGEYSFAVQEEQKGTGHAVMCAEKDFEGYEGNVLVLSGDMPLVSNKTLEDLCNFHESNKNACSVLSVENKNESSFGRIIRNSDGSFKGIVEKKDCTPEQLASTELNAGIYVFDSKLLFKYLHDINSDNAQGEYYITDVPAVLIKNGFSVDAFKIFDLDETLGVNTVEDLEMVEKVLQSRK